MPFFIHLIAINLKWGKQGFAYGNHGPSYHVTINGITEEYDDVILHHDVDYKDVRLDLFIDDGHDCHDKLIRRIILNDNVEVKISDEVKDWWKGIPR